LSCSIVTLQAKTTNGRGYARRLKISNFAYLYREKEATSDGSIVKFFKTTGRYMKFLYVGMRVKSLEESIKFYTNVFGMRLSDRTKIEQTKGEVANLVSEDGGFPLELNYYQDDSPYATEYTVGEGLDHLAFLVEDIDEAIARAKKFGSREVLEVRTEKSRWAYVEDPNGIWVELCK
jgi:lactoylglutathione lyase